MLKFVKRVTVAATGDRAKSVANFVDSVRHLCISDVDRVVSCSLLG